MKASMRAFWMGRGELDIVRAGASDLRCNTVLSWGCDAYERALALRGLNVIPYVAMSNLNQIPDLAETLQCIGKLSTLPNVHAILVAHELARVENSPAAAAWFKIVIPSCHAMGLEPIAKVDDPSNKDQQWLRTLGCSYWVNVRPYSYHCAGTKGYFNWDMGESIVLDGRAWDILAKRLPALIDSRIGPLRPLDGLAIEATGLDRKWFDEIRELPERAGQTMYPNADPATYARFQSMLPHAYLENRCCFCYYHPREMRQGLESLREHPELCTVIRD